MEDLMARYLDTLESVSGERRWYESSTALRFAALHLTVGDRSAHPSEIQALAAALGGVPSRIDPLRAFTVPMAGLAAARRLTGPQAAAALGDAIAQFESAPRPMGKTDRSRALPALALAIDGGSPRDAPEQVRVTHGAWNARHRWMTTGRHFSFAAMAVAAGLDPEVSAESAEAAHDLLGQAGYWHEWDASILLSFSRHEPDQACARYQAAVRGFMGNERKPPPIARDDLAMVSLAEAEPANAGERLAEYYRRLLDTRPRPSRQVALALAAALVVTASRDGDDRLRVVIDGFGLFAYAEALREEAPD